MLSIIIIRRPDSHVKPAFDPGEKEHLGLALEAHCHLSIAI